MNVNVSENIESKLRDIARRQGQDVADVAGLMLEEKVKDTEIKSSGRKKLSDLAGIYFGGNGQTAENAAEILRSEIDKRSGFGK